MPPLELISCGAVAREWCGAEVKLIDAIAEQLTVDETICRIKSFAPDFTISITGFECFEEDVDIARLIKGQIPDCTFVMFGHYATQFPEETLIHSGFDYVISGEPELVLRELLTTLMAGTSADLVRGIAYRKEDQTIKQGENGRIRDPNELPVPAYDLLPQAKYYEPLLAKPYGMIQTVRGCPYKCNYCVKSYGSKLSQLTTDRVIREMKLWIELQGVRSIRFIDDTFTINRNRVMELCRAIISEKIKVEWACLSRTDNLDEELLIWMKKSGCKRIYFGMESGSQRMLDIYKKNVSVDEALASFALCRRVGIETAAFFMSGHPEETEQDFFETVDFVKSADLNYASFNPLTPYPGTGLFDEIKDQLDFSIYPYKNEWKAKSMYSDFSRRKEIFYKSFYVRLRFISRNVTVLLKNAGQIIVLGWGMIRYLWGDKRFVISGIKGAQDK